MARRAKTRGGHRLTRFIRNAKRAKIIGVRQVEAGFYESSRYPPVSTGKNGGRRQSPQPVTNVAAWNEFGTRGGGWGGPTPERPFFRNAIKAMKPKVRNLVRAKVDPKLMVVTPQIGGLIGNVMKNEIQASIGSNTPPPNSPTTVEIKAGKGGTASTLIDTGFMRQSVTYKVVK